MNVAIASSASSVQLIIQYCSAKRRLISIRDLTPLLEGEAAGYRRGILFSHRIPRNSFSRPAEAAEAPERVASDAVAPATAAAASDEKMKDKEQREGPGLLGRIWLALFGGPEDDFEKRLQHLSKEEADVLARMRRRTQFSRRGVRNLVVLSVLGEVGAVVYAVIMTKLKDLDWQKRAISLLPMFLLPALSSMLYSILISFTRMLERKDQTSLERLRGERKAKIDELKEKTNYYLTHQLIQKYDFDPAAKAAAASVLASKMGAETGQKVSMGHEAKSDSTPARSSNVEVQNRKETKGKGASEGSTRIFRAQQDASNESVSAGMDATQPSKVVGHYQGSGTSAGGWIAKVAALLVGEDPSHSYALICGNCHMHNGLARKEDFPHVTYYCPHCHALNRSNQSMEQDSDSDQLSPIAPADRVSTRDHIADTDTEMSSTT